MLCIIHPLYVYHGDGVGHTGGGDVLVVDCVYELIHQDHFYRRALYVYFICILKEVTTSYRTQRECFVY